ncbi:hypothetical protein SAMN04489867_0504 [Pedococcus dokdonensis]|uniref:Uncharacterized protein n=1 Tax=Pedococcus dokdonensis TaxID=443156 RepID=A0A1H0M635_9MICO|nr:hypothetical protein SAMN04489867_0504 [Pedococcus dokdonensis]
MPDQTGSPAPTCGTAGQKCRPHPTSGHPCPIRPGPQPRHGAPLARSADLPRLLATHARSDRVPSPDMGHRWPEVPTTPDLRPPRLLATHARSDRVPSPDMGHRWPEVPTSPDFWPPMPDQTGSPAPTWGTAGQKCRPPPTSGHPCPIRPGSQPRYGAPLARSADHPRLLATHARSDRVSSPVMRHRWPEVPSSPDFWPPMPDQTGSPAPSCGTAGQKCRPPPTSGHPCPIRPGSQPRHAAPLARSRGAREGPAPQPSEELAVRALPTTRHTCWSCVSRAASRASRTSR